MFSQKRGKQKRVGEGTKHRCGLSWDSLALWGVLEQETTTKRVHPWDKWVGLLYSSISHHFQWASRGSDSSWLSSSPTQRLVFLPCCPPMVQTTMRYVICELTEVETTKRWPPFVAFVTGHCCGSSLPSVQHALTYSTAPGSSVAFGNSSFSALSRLCEV